MGYFPTGEEDCSAIGSWLEGYGYTILDPCCGAGTALKTITLNMSGYGESFGIEIEEGRAEKAKEVLDAVIHEDLFNLGIEHRSFGAVFLNPPYYQSEALHQPFIEKATEVLAPEGILILIIPDYEVCGKTSSFLSSFYDIIKVFKAIDQRFSQVIIFGLKKKRPEIQEGKDISLLAQCSLSREGIAPSARAGRLCVIEAVDGELVRCGIVLRLLSSFVHCSPLPLLSWDI